MIRRAPPPRLLYVTDAARSSRDVVEVARAAASGGIDAVQVREPMLTDREVVELARRMVAAVEPFGTLVLVNERFDLAIAAGAHGVHLRAGGIDAARVREAAETATNGTFLVGLATHDGAQLEDASRRGDVDYCTIGPFGASPGKSPLGEDGLSRLLEDVRSRVQPCAYLVLGGVGPSEVSQVARLSRPGETWGVAAVRALQEAGDDDAIRRVAMEFRAAMSRGAR